MHDRLQVSARNGTDVYLSEMCRPSSSEAGRRHLRSANCGQLVVPRYRLTTAGRRAFSCAGPSAWNSLPEYLTVDTLTLVYFKRSLKCFLFARYWHSAWSALGFVMIVRYINVHLIINNNNNTNSLIRNIRRPDDHRATVILPICILANNKQILLKSTANTIRNYGKLKVQPSARVYVQ